MLSLLLAWLFSAVLSIAWGIGAWKLIQHFFSNSEKQPPNLPIDHFLLLGFLSITITTSYISIISPVNSFVKLLFAIVGFFIIYNNFSIFKNIIFKSVFTWKNTQTITKTLIFIMGITTLYLGTGKIIHYDTLYYHLQTIQWIENFPVVPGLGNIHTRLAYNSHFFLPSAFFSVHLFDKFVLYPLNSFFYFLFSTKLIIDLDKHIRQQNHFDFTLKLFVLLLFLYHCTDFVNSTSTDSTTSVLMFYVFFLFLGWRRDVNRRPAILPLLWITVFTVVTFKLSSLLLLLILPFTLGRQFTKRAIALTMLGSFILLPFFVRNYYLSGYLVFPHPKVDLFEVDWKVPTKEAIIDEKFIEVWAKLPNGQRSELESYTDAEIVSLFDIKGLNWVLPWFATFGIKWKLILFINFLTIPVLLLAIYKKHYTIAILALVLLANFAFWLLKAPNPRFGYGILFMAVGLNLAYLQQFLCWRLPKVQLQGAIFLLVIGMIASNKTLLLAPRDQSFTAILLPEKLQNIEIRNFTTNNFTLHTPYQDRRCYNAPIPCTPYPKKNIAKRGKSLKKGFSRITEETIDSTLYIGSLKIK